MIPFDGKEAILDKALNSDYYDSCGYDNSAYHRGYKEGVLAMIDLMEREINYDI